MSKLSEWMKRGEHLPEFMRAFHDQKDLFKAIHSLYQDNDGAEEKPTWVQGHIYVIDWFLWYMALRGYTLQKSRKKVDFKSFK